MVKVLDGRRNFQRFELDCNLLSGINESTAGADASVEALKLYHSDI